MSRREKVIRLLEFGEAHTEARNLLGWAGVFRVAANELRAAHRALTALGVQDPESPEDVWTAFTEGRSI